MDRACRNSQNLAVGEHVASQILSKRVLSYQLCIRIVSTDLTSLSTNQKYIIMILSISNGQTEYRELFGIDGKQIRITIGYITAPMEPMPSGLDTLADGRS